MVDDWCFSNFNYFKASLMFNHTLRKTTSSIGCINFMPSVSCKFGIRFLEMKNTIVVIWYDTLVKELMYYYGMTKFWVWLNHNLLSWILTYYLIRYLERNYSNCVSRYDQEKCMNREGQWKRWICVMRIWSKCWFKLSVSSIYMESNLNWKLFVRASIPLRAFGLLSGMIGYIVLDNIKFLKLRVHHGISCN